jgi:hypothetical protein
VLAARVPHVCMICHLSATLGTICNTHRECRMIPSGVPHVCLACHLSATLNTPCNTRRECCLLAVRVPWCAWCAICPQRMPHAAPHTHTGGSQHTRYACESPSNSPRPLSKAIGNTMLKHRNHILAVGVACLPSECHLCVCANIVC